MSVNGLHHETLAEAVRSLEARQMITVSEQTRRGKFRDYRIRVFTINAHTLGSIVRRFRCVPHRKARTPEGSAEAPRALLGASHAGHVCPCDSCDAGGGGARPGGPPAPTGESILRMRRQAWTPLNLPPWGTCVRLLTRYESGSIVHSRSELVLSESTTRTSDDQT